MSRFRQYAVAGMLSALLLAALFLAGALFVKERETSSEPEIMTLPHGRVLYVVCEQHGAYVGEELVAFADFDQFVRGRRRAFGPDYFIVAVTPDARYGDVAAVFASLRRATEVPGTIETRIVPPGTRRPIIAVREYFWQY